MNTLTSGTPTGGTEYITSETPTAGVLEVFDGWTIDRRLKQLRKIRESDEKILFVDFEDDLGEMLFEKMILIDQLKDQNLDYEYSLKKGWGTEEEERCLRALHEAIFKVNTVISKLERELK